MMGDHLDVAVAIDHLGQSSYTLVFHMMKDGVEVVRGRFVTVTTSLDTHKPIPIPGDIRTALERYRERCGG
jgi:4-hydroxybenzoyl-CoA thioesterase/acyl-CoA thioester hydrolase